MVFHLFLFILCTSVDTSKETLTESEKPFFKKQSVFKDVALCQTVELVSFKSVFIHLPIQCAWFCCRFGLAVAIKLDSNVHQTIRHEACFRCRNFGVIVRGNYPNGPFTTTSPNHEAKASPWCRCRDTPKIWVGLDVNLNVIFLMIFALVTSRSKHDYAPIETWKSPRGRTPAAENGPSRRATLPAPSICLCVA